MKVTYGVHAVEALLSSNSRVTALYVLSQRKEQRLENLIGLAEKRRVSVHAVNKNKLESLAEGGNHQGVVALSEEATLAVGNEVDLEKRIAGSERPFLLFLDGVQDPHNLGACLRTAYAFGVDAIVAPRDRSVGLTPAVRKVACGAAELLPFIQVTNLARTMQDLKEQGIWFYGADASAEKTVAEQDYSGAIAWVLGAEGRGLREQTRKLCDFLVKIPMVNPMESLNVSVACGICLYASR